MYTSTFLSLNTALSGVEVAQEQLDTTGENISNANAPGYEEQVVNTSTLSGLGITGPFGNPLQEGTGVGANTIVNQDNPYLNAAYRQQNAATSAANTLQTYTNQLNAALDEPSTSAIASQLQTFWSAWSSVVQDPTSTAAQQAVVQDANTLATSFNSLASDIDGSGSGSILSQAVDQYDDITSGPSGANGAGSIYTDASNIASLNQQIVQESQGGGDPNSLIDERNSYIDDLSQYGNVTVTDNSDGSVNVAFAGVPATSGTGTDQLLVDGTQGAGGNNFTNWSAGLTAMAGAATSASSLSSTMGGTLGALVGLTGWPVSSGDPTTATLEGTLGQVMGQLNAVANDLGQNVNNPEVDGVSTGLVPPLFGTSDTQTFTAADLSVNPSLMTNPSQLQIGATGAAAGDTSIAQAEAALGGEQGMTSANGTFYPTTPYGTTALPTSAYAAFVEGVGSTAQAANENESTQSALQTQISNQRTSAEGVDLSQEMTNLIEEQQAYEASAKVMNTFSSMMDSLMTIVGQ